MNILPIGTLLYCFFMGIITGIIYFGGLWFTVQKIRKAKKYVLIMLSSWIIRTAFLIGMLYVVMQNNIQRILVMMLGIICVRYLAPRVLKKYKKIPNLDVNMNKDLANGKL
ncbi:MAG: ATP synthase subunit I [Alphaproteobacteria bacterium]|nr:ATP synthase subunit I [Alphaproteobacteria bacterium]